MRVAVVSDIHGNVHALEAVLADMLREAPDEVWCLGDIVGYGPRPNECCSLIRGRATLSLCGNHDLAVVGALDDWEFRGEAGQAVRWTRTVLEPGHAEWLRSLAPSGHRDRVQLFHGSPRDPIWDYVLSDEVAVASLRATVAPVVLVGHSHVALALALEDDELSGGQAPESTLVALDGRRVLLNPGSVGQPRDGDPRAAWLLLDLDGGTATFRRTPYATAQTQAEIREAKLPEILAERLELGI